MTEADYTHYQHHAEEAGQTLSDFARDAMDMRIGREVRERVWPVARKSNEDR